MPVGQASNIKRWNGPGGNFVDLGNVDKHKEIRNHDIYTEL